MRQKIEANTKWLDLRNGLENPAAHPDLMKRQRESATADTSPNDEGA